jgi:hypothetical protein
MTVDLSVRHLRMARPQVADGGKVGGFERCCRYTMNEQSGRADKWRSSC